MKYVHNCSGHALKIPNIVDNQGVYLFDDQGKRFMDLESGVWCISVGHRNARINQTIIRQVDSVMHAGFCYSHPVVDRSARSILAVTGLKHGKCVFLSSGSEAIEFSRQIARHICGGKKSMTLHDSYLGAYDAVTDRNGGWHVFNWEPCMTCETMDQCDPGCEILQEIPEQISDFIFEPGSASGFVRFPPIKLIQNIVNIVHKNNGMVIANEVTTGVGRTGTWFGFQHYDIQPDMVAMGKGIGNGYPVSVAAMSQATIGALQSKPFKYSQSHQNDPLGAAVAKSVIEYIQDQDLIAAAQKKGAIFRSHLESLVDNRIIRAIRGRGLMLAVDIVDSHVGMKMYDDLIEKGYIVGNRGRTFRIDPPLVITETEFESFIDTLRALLASKKYTT